MGTTVPFASDLGFWRRKCNFNQKQWRHGRRGGVSKPGTSQRIKTNSYQLFINLPSSPAQGKKNSGKAKAKTWLWVPWRACQRVLGKSQEDKASGSALFPWTIPQPSSLSEAVYLDTLLPLYCSFNIHLSKGKMLMCIIRISIVYEWTLWQVQLKAKFWTISQKQ